MAANFTAEKRCQGIDCKERSGVLYNVREKQILCDQCAENKDFAIKTGKDDTKWFCEKHAKAIKFYCDSHDLGICQSCAIVRHQQSCVLHDLDDIVTERKRALKGLLIKATEKLADLRKHEQHNSQLELDGNSHLLSVEREIRMFFEATLRHEDANLQREEDMIKQEADEEISKVNQRKEQRLLQSRKKARAKQDKITKVQNELLISLTEIRDEHSRKFKNCHDRIRESQLTMRKTLSDIEALLLTNRELIEGGKHLVTSLNHTVVSVQEGEEVESEGISSTVQSVRFVKSHEDDSYRGRVDWRGGNWELSDSLEIPEDVKFPMIAGCINEEEVVVSDRSFDNPQTYVTNVRTKRTEIVAQNDRETFIASCTLLDENTIVCGKRWRGCSGPVLSNCITLYDRQWQLVRHLDIPRHMQTNYARVEVAVDKCGMLLACEAGQSNIYVIDPKSEETESVVTCKSGNMIRMRGVKTSGEIIARRAPFDETLLIIDRHGDQKEIEHGDTVWYAAIDPLTDDPYVVCYDAESNICSIDRMSYDGGTGVRELSLSLWEGLNTRNERLWHVVSSGLILTSDGKLIFCDGRNIMIYRKKFLL